HTHHTLHSFPTRRSSDLVTLVRVERTLFDEVQKIQENPPLPHELKRALAQINAQYAYTLDGVARQGFLIGIFEHVMSFETLGELVKKLEIVTPGQVSEVARKYLTQQNRTVCKCVGTRNQHGS